MVSGFWRLSRRVCGCREKLTSPDGTPPTNPSETLALDHSISRCQPVDNRLLLLYPLDFITRLVCLSTVGRIYYKDPACGRPTLERHPVRLLQTVARPQTTVLLDIPIT